MIYPLIEIINRSLKLVWPSLGLYPVQKHWGYSRYHLIYELTKAILLILANELEARRETLIYSRDGCGPGVIERMGFPLLLTPSPPLNKIKIKCCILRHICTIN